MTYIRNGRELTAADTVDGFPPTTCKVCGMLANVDPFFHAERYGHVPVWDQPPSSLDNEPDPRDVFYFAGVWRPKVT